MRARFGSLVPVWLAPGVPATLVVGYWTALGILNDPEHFPADPSVWQRGIPPQCPVLPMMQKRPNALRSSGIEYARYRAANVDALSRVDLTVLHAVVERSAVRLISGFSGRGRADLLGDYAYPLVFEVIGELIGCEPEISERVAAGMAMMFDTTADAVEGNRVAVRALGNSSQVNGPGRVRTSRPGCWLIPSPWMTRNSSTSCSPSTRRRVSR